MDPREALTKKLTAITLAAALVLTLPGLGFYQALAAVSAAPAAPVPAGAAVWFPYLAGLNGPAGASLFNALRLDFRAPGKLDAFARVLGRTPLRPQQLDAGLSPEQQAERMLNAVQGHAASVLDRSRRASDPSEAQAAAEQLEDLQAVLSVLPETEQRAVAEARQSLRVARVEPAAVVPPYLKDWSAFAQANQDSFRRFESIRDGGARLDMPAYPQVVQGLKSALRKHFPRIAQPKEEFTVILPPPHVMKSVTALRSGFELSLPERADQERFLSREDYLGLLAERRYPMRDYHDLVDHWPGLSRIAAGDYAEMARTALKLGDPSVLPASVSLMKASAMHQSIAGNLDYYASRQARLPRRHIFRAVARDAATAARFAGVPRLQDTQLARWAAEQGRFGRILAGKIVPFFALRNALTFRPRSAAWAAVLAGAAMFVPQVALAEVVEGPSDPFGSGFPGGSFLPLLAGLGALAAGIFSFARKKVPSLRALGFRLAYGLIAPLRFPLRLWVGASNYDGLSYFSSGYSLYPWGRLLIPWRVYFFGIAHAYGSVPAAMILFLEGTKAGLLAASKLQEHGTDAAPAQPEAGVVQTAEKEAPPPPLTPGSVESGEVKASLVRLQPAVPAVVRALDEVDNGLFYGILLIAFGGALHILAHPALLLPVGLPLVLAIGAGALFYRWAARNVAKPDWDRLHALYEEAGRDASKYSQSLARLAAEEFGWPDKKALHETYLLSLLDGWDEKAGDLPKKETLSVFKALGDLQGLLYRRPEFPGHRDLMPPDHWPERVPTRLHLKLAAALGETTPSPSPLPEGEGTRVRAAGDAVPDRSVAAPQAAGAPETNPPGPPPAGEDSQELLYKTHEPSPLHIFMRWLPMIGAATVLAALGATWAGMDRMSLIMAFQFEQVVIFALICLSALLIPGAVEPDWKRIEDLFHGEAAGDPDLFEEKLHLRLKEQFNSPEHRPVLERFALALFRGLPEHPAIPLEPTAWAVMAVVRQRGSGIGGAERAEIEKTLEAARRSEIQREVDAQLVEEWRVEEKMRQQGLAEAEEILERELLVLAAAGQPPVPAWDFEQATPNQNAVAASHRLKSTK